MPSLTRLTSGGVLNPLKNTTNTSHNELLHQDPLQPPLEPRATLVRTLSGAWPGFSRLGPTLRARTLALDCACKPLDAHVNR